MAMTSGLRNVVASTPSLFGDDLSPASPQLLALSLWQPWASAIGPLKTIETRSWITRHRGLLAIHAAKRWQSDQREFAEDMRVWLDRRNRPSLPITFPFGCIVAVVDLIDCRPTDDRSWVVLLDEIELAFGNYQPGRYGWILANIRPVREPIPCPGAQGLWTVPPDIADRVMAGA
jgi:hypothetical protein